MKEEYRIFSPLVSIVIPVYNGSNYVKEAIDSALAQTYKNIEIIVINDGSNDGGKTNSIIKSYGDKVRYFTKPNGGISTALNMGIKMMKGQYFSWLSHDDKYSDAKIEHQVELLKNIEDKTTVIYCSSYHINKNSLPIKTLKKTSMLSKRMYNWNEILLLMLQKGTLNGCAFLIHKSIFDKCGMFDESLRYNQDAFMWYKIFLNKYNLVYTSYPGVMSRVHNAQLTQTGIELFHNDCVNMSTQLISEFSRISTKKDNFLFAYAECNAKYNNSSVVKSCIENGRKAKLFSFFMIMKLKIILLYGKIRPFIRRIYHRIFTKIKTQ